MTRRFGCVALALLAAVFAATSTSAATVSDSNWTIQKLPTPAVAPNGQLMGTSCTSDRLCVAVGVAQDSSGRDTALAERWNGNRWEGQSTPTLRGAVGTFLAGVSCAAPNACTAVGNLENGSGQHVTLAERWNGIDWDMQFTPNPSGATDSFLSGVSCASAGSAVHLEQGGLRVGTGWRISTLPALHGTAAGSPGDLRLCRTHTTRL